MKYKMICSDLDDTLIGSSQELSENVKNAIHRYIDNGGKFVIVTGRMTSGALPVCKELGLYGEVITFQGAVVADIASGKILEEAVFSTEQAVEICKAIEELGWYYQTYIDDYFITEKANLYTKGYAKLSRARYEETGIKVSEYVQNNNLKPPKFLLMDDENIIKERVKILQAKFGDKYLVNTSKPFIIEIVLKSINKGSAVANLAKKYNIKREEIICVGDSENDISMLSYAGLGIAVGNGNKIAKEHADLIAPSADDDAIAWIINNIALKKE